MFPLNTTTYPLTRGIRVELAAIIVVCLLGLLSQFRLWKVIRERREKQEAILAEEQQKKDEAELELGRTLEEKKLHELARWEAVYGEQSKRESTIAEKPAVTPGLHRTHSAPILRKDSGADVEMVALSVAEGNKVPFMEKHEGNAKDANTVDEKEAPKETEEAKHSETPEDVEDAEHGKVDEAPENPPVRVPTPLQCVQSPPFKIPNPNDKGHEDDVHSIQAIVDDGDSTANRLSRRLSAYSILQRLSRRGSSRRNSRQLTSVSQEMLVPQSPSSPASSVQGIPDDVSFEMQDAEPHADLDAQSNTEIHEDRDDELKESTPIEPDPKLAPAVEEQNSPPPVHEDPEPQPDQETAIENSTKIITEKEADEEQNVEQPQGLGLSSAKRPDTSDGRATSFLEVAPAPPAKSVVASTAETASKKGKSVESPKMPQQAHLRPQPSTNSRSSTEKKESLTAGAVEHLPSHVSPLITSYRTNEWAKHLSVADTPALEEIELSPTLVNSDEETTVPVKVEELTQTATNAAPPPAAIDRRASLPEKLDIVQRAASNVSKRSAPATPLEAAPQRLSNIYMDNAATHPANMHAASSPDLLQVNSARSPPPNVIIPGGFRSSSTPFLATSLAASPIDESQVVNYDSQPIEGSLPLMAQREQMVQSRMSFMSLTRQSWVPPRSQSRQSGDEDQRSPTSSQLNLPDEDDMPLTQRRVLLRQHSIGPANMVPKAEDPGRLAADVYPANARLSRDSRVSVQSKSMKMAAWRESLQEDLTRSQTPLVDVDVARQGMMDQQRRAQIAKTQRALASENLNNSIAERMRRGEMQDVHREAMRRMQATANRQAQDGNN